MFLGATCLNHGEVGTLPCCDTLHPYTFTDTGAVYPNGQHACWYADCVPAGKAAGPNGQGNYCCSPLINVAGKCALPTGSGNTNCASIGQKPVVGQICCSGYTDNQGICSTGDLDTGLVPGIGNSTLLMVAGGAVLLLILMGGKKKNA